MKVKADSFSVAQYVFVCIVHNNKQIQMAHHQMLQLMVMMIAADRGVL
jgi:hypothetical protein